jgi:hypothetical protein
MMMTWPPKSLQDWALVSKKPPNVVEYEESHSNHGKTMLQDPKATLQYHSLSPPISPYMWKMKRHSIKHGVKWEIYIITPSINQ